MDRLTNGVRALFIFVLVTAGCAGNSLAPLAAQPVDVDPTRFTSELSDLEIEISDDEFEIYAAEHQTYAHGEGEIVQIASSTAYIQIAFFDDTDSILETLDIYNDAFAGDVDQFEVIDEGETRDTVFTLARATYGDETLTYYLSVTEDIVDNVDLLQRVYAPDAAFADDLERAQDAISIGRDGLLEDVDTAALGERAGATPDSRGRIDDDPGGEPEEEETPPASRTGGDAYEFEIVPAVVTVSGDVRIDESSVDAPLLEQLWIAIPGGETAALVQVLQNPADPEATLDIILENFGELLTEPVNIGTDADATTAWSLDAGEFDGVPVIMYLHVDSDRYRGFHLVEFLLAAETTFLNDLDTLVRDVEIDGEAMFGDSDLETVEALLTGQALPDNRGTRDDDPGDGESGRTSDRRIDARIGDEGDDPDTDDDAAILDLESQGLVSGGEFESLQHGVVVEWDETVWGVDPTWELSARSNTEVGIDAVILFWLDGNVASMMIEIWPADGLVPADLVDTWESGEFVESMHEDAEVLISDSGRRSGGVVLLVYDDDGEELILLQEVVDLDGGDTFAVVTMFASPEEFVDAYGDAGDLITIDGEDAVGTFTSRELDNAVAP